MNFFPRLFPSLVFLFLLGFPFLAHCANSTNNLGDIKSEFNSVINTPQFVNFNFEVTFSKDGPHMGGYLVMCATEIYKHVRRFYRLCDPRFVQTALFQLEFFAATLCSLSPNAKYFASIEQIGQIRLSILNLVKDVPMITTIINPINA